MKSALARYLGGLLEAWQVSGVLGYLLVGVWLLYPVAVATVFHPADAVGFQAWLQGAAIPRWMTHQMLLAGEGWAVLTLAGLSLIQLCLVTVIYRICRFFVQFWPLALFLVGGIANGLWYLRTGYFDPGGAMAGLSPLLAAIVCHGVCERLGADFVFGPGPKPEYEPAF